MQKKYNKKIFKEYSFNEKNKSSYLLLIIIDLQYFKYYKKKFFYGKKRRCDKIFYNFLIIF